jgi:hypothetical protein
MQNIYVILKMLCYSKVFILTVYYCVGNLTLYTLIQVQDAFKQFYRIFFYQYDFINEAKEKHDIHLLRNYLSRQEFGKLRLKATIGNCDCDPFTL